MFSIQRGQKKEIPVILPKHATAAENFAAEELKTVLEQVFQAETIYLAENSPFIDGCISIGETELMKKNFSQIYDGLETDDCAVACKNNTLFLFGKTDDFSSAGTIYAVYEFAERWLGVRYLAWDESFYPPRQELALEEMLHVSRPDFILRQYLAPAAIFSGGNKEKPRVYGPPSFEGYVCR